MVTRSQDLRTRQLAAIHTAKKALGLEDAEYRNYLVEWTGKDSSAAMNSDERERVIEHLRAMGFRRSGDFVRVEDDDGPQVRKIKMMWLELVRLKAAKNADMKALNAWVTRQAGVDHVRWLTPAQAAAVIEALKAWTDRVQGARRRKAA